jgi:hypothetical protein
MGQVLYKLFPTAKLGFYLGTIRTFFNVYSTKYVALLRENELKREVLRQAKRRSESGEKKEKRVAFVLIVRMSIPLLSSSESALTA